MPRVLNFISCEESLQSADIVLIGFPYDGTSSYRPGSRFAPSSIREASHGLETYSPHLGLSLDDKRVCDEGDLVFPFGNKERTLTMIREKMKELLEAEKNVLSLGGEHLITYPIIQEYYKRYPELIIVQFDAHTDLRHEYLGEKESHATVLRRVYDVIGGDNIYQFGIRSGTKKEFLFGKENCHFYPFSLENVKKEISLIPDSKPIYITIDLDILDPSILPGTGTPEPGGITFNELLAGIHALKDKNIVGGDVVELSPNYDQSDVSNIVAAKVVRELLLLL